MGQKYAAYNTTGNIIGFYDSIDSPLPNGKNAIPISDQQWQMCLQTPGGFMVVNKILTATTVPSSVATPPTPVQLAQAALNAGVTVISNSTASISGSYAVDAISLAKIMNTAMYVQMNGKFPAAQTTLTWLDMGKNPHVFPTTDLFLTFANAISDYVSLIDTVINGTSTTLPTNPITII